MTTLAVPAPPTLVRREADAAPSAPLRTEVIEGVTYNADLGERPYLIDGAPTILHLWRARCRAFGARTAHREKHLGIWKSHSWNAYYEQARLIAMGLRALGVGRGEVVSVLSEDRKEWLYVDMAVQGLGAITSGVYTTDSPSQLAYLVEDSGTRVLFVENDEHLDKWLAARERMPGLVKVIVFEREGLHGFSDPMVMFLDDLVALGAEAAAVEPDVFDREIDKARPEDTALLIYTSGTTGPPKGAMITHENIVFALSSGARCLRSLGTDEQLCFLPLCHVWERFTSVYTPIVSGATVNFAESPETVFDNLREVGPTIFSAVPRVWEKVYSRVSIMVGEATPAGRLAYKWALGAGFRKLGHELAGRPVPLLDGLVYRLADAFVLSNLRRMIGLHNIRRANSGAAPVSPDLLRWYQAIGVPILEGYGQTETAAFTSVNQPERIRNGTVGPLAPGIGCRIAPDGEIQVKAPNVFAGYWKKPEKTAESFTEDGWLKTGDVGEIDADGFLKITGRLKDIIITAGGKNITPAEIENKLKFSPYVSDAVIIGDRRKYLTALVMLDQENVEKFAQDNRVPFSDYASLCAAPQVVELIGSVVEEVNKDFARVEQIKDFRIIDVLLTAEDDELTATMKLKRGFVEKKYKALIDQMYAAA